MEEGDWKGWSPFKKPPPSPLSMNKHYMGSQREAEPLGEIPLSPPLLKGEREGFRQGRGIKGEGLEIAPGLWARELKSRNG